MVKSTVALVQEVLLSNSPSQSQPLADQCSDLLQQASQASKGQLSIVIMLVKFCCIQEMIWFLFYKVFCRKTARYEQ